MPLHIEDDKTVDLVTDRLLAFYEEFSLPERTGLEADKGFGR